MSKKRPVWSKTAVSAAVVLPVLFSGPSVLAQAVREIPVDRYADEFPTVRDRWDGLGVRTGSFWILPSVETGIVYDSNVFALPTDHVDDTVFYVRPNIEAKSDFSRHAIGISAGLEHLEYFDQKTETRTNGWGNIGGRIDVQRNTQVFLGVGGGVFHEGRGTINTPTFSTKPIQYTEGGFAGELYHTFNRVSVSVNGGARRLDYRDGVSALTGMVIEQDFRDFKEYQVGGRLGYLAAVGYTIFADGQFSTTDYDQGFYDADRMRVTGGVAFDLTNLVRGEVGIGYGRIDYKNPLFKDRSTPSYNVALVWNPTPLMTLSFDGAQTFQDSTLVDANGVPISGSIQSSLRTTLDYEVTRSFVLSPFIGFNFDDFNQAALENTDWSTGLRADYDVNRYLDVGVNYIYQDQNFSRRLQDYNRHLVGVFAKARF